MGSQPVGAPPRPQSASSRGKDAAEKSKKQDVDNSSAPLDDGVSYKVVERGLGSNDVVDPEVAEQLKKDRDAGNIIIAV